MKKFKRNRGSKKHIHEKKRKIFSKQLVWGFGIIFLMVASVIGFMWKGGAEADYQGYQFERSGNGWTTEINKQNVFFYTLPEESEYINISAGVLDKIKNTQMIYMTFDPDQLDLSFIDLARFDLTETLPAYFNAYTVDGVITENENYDLPIVTCKNATPFVPVLYFKSGNKTQIELDGNCIIAESSTESGFIRIRDRIIYGLFGIIG